MLLLPTVSEKYGKINQDLRKAEKETLFQKLIHSRTSRYLEF